MWDRRQLKDRAKAAFQANYWRCVLVSFVMFALLGGGLASGGNRVRESINLNQSEPQTGSATLNAGDVNSIVGLDLEELGGMEDLTPAQVQALLDAVKDTNKYDFSEAEVLPMLVILGGVLSVVIAASSVVSILLYNPLEVSAANFYTTNAQSAASLDTMERGFVPHWTHNVWTMFLCDLFTLLWGMLFIVPGIVKGYAYRMVPYIMAEHPELTGTEAITLSRKMMKGNKWRAFVLDLSFLGWEILGGLTAGILDIFWVRPYKAAANAELYLAIRGGSADNNTAAPEFE
ncbi:MAG: DUF975 family protein [Oscillospiraceae bacterium]|nr:DUF975 family protein [Oscillospiraceae bacterium]